jgi:glycosyltransferase involved in cell wall biosynthesis
MTDSRHRTQIPPVPPTLERPLWSVMIPTYNSAAFLAQTLQSVLAQDPGASLMQIEVVDDSSTDDPEAIVRKLGGDRIGFFRQPQNRGHVLNFDTCLLRARGELVHILHGDDAVRADFYATMELAFANHPEIGAAFCRQIIIDEESRWLTVSRMLEPRSGVLPDWLRTIAIGQRLQTPAMTVRRSVYEHLGGFDQRIRSYGEDWEMWVRIAANYPVWHQVEPLALYRIRQRSLSHGTVQTGENVADLLRAVEINREVLPREVADEISSEARKAIALASIRRAHRLVADGEVTAAVAQVRAALRASKSPRVFENAAAFFFRLSRRAAVRGLLRRTAR